MTNLLSDPLTLKIFGLTGAAIAILGSLISAFAYTGKEGEKYSPLNHFISELGEVGISKLAWVFNYSLILTGICLVLASISLGLILPGVLAKLALAAGVISAISLSLVGVFPMNKIKPHGYAAITYFRAGLAMVILFSLAIAFPSSAQLVLPRCTALAGLPPIFAFSGFLVLIGQAYKDADDPLATEDVQRPKIWLLAIVEWLIFITILLWIFIVVIGF